MAKKRRRGNGGSVALCLSLLHAYYNLVEQPVELYDCRDEVYDMGRLSTFRCSTIQQARCAHCVHTVCTDRDCNAPRNSERGKTNKQKNKNKKLKLTCTCRVLFKFPFFVCRSSAAAYILYILYYIIAGRKLRHGRQEVQTVIRQSSDRRVRRTVRTSQYGVWCLRSS